MINITPNFRTSLYNLLQLNFYEIVIRVDMLLHETLHFQEGGEEVPLVLGCVYGVCEGFVAVEWLEESVEALSLLVYILWEHVGRYVGGRTSDDGTFRGIEGCSWCDWDCSATGSGL
jgi:hypothetical protein